VPLSISQTIGSDSLRQPVLRTPGEAFRRSLLLPGYGQLYNGKPIKAAVYSGIVLVSAGVAAYNWDRALGSNVSGSLFWNGEAWAKGRNNWLILGGLTYILCAVDAYVDAHLQTFDVAPISLEVGQTRDGVRTGLAMRVTVPLP
jgi:hypothetical protein